MRVLLLKSDAQDTYKEYLDSPDYQATCIPVLGHELCNQDQLQDAIESGSYSGVIFTSQRAVEAWGQISSGATKMNWFELPFYTVGPATSQALLNLQSAVVPPEELILGGADTGRAEELGRFIVKRLKGEKLSGKEMKPLLYLVGDKRRDTLTAILSQAGIPVEELTVYKTSMAKEFPTQVESYLQDAANGPIWLVFFSPSGVQYAWSKVKDHWENNQKPAGSTYQRLRLAAIGPTTLDYLQIDLGIAVDAVCDQPTAECLLKVLQDAEKA